MEFEEDGAKFGVVFGVNGGAGFGVELTPAGGLGGEESGEERERQEDAEWHGFIVGHGGREFILIFSKLLKRRGMGAAGEGSGQGLPSGFVVAHPAESERKGETPLARASL